MFSRKYIREEQRTETGGATYWKPCELDALLPIEKSLHTLVWCCDSSTVTQFEVNVKFRSILTVSLQTVFKNN